MTQYIIYAWDYQDDQALNRRMAAREEHLAKAKILKENGNLLIACAILDDNQKMIGSTLVLQFETEQELENWKKNEPYVLQNVWEKIDIKTVKVANL